MSKSEKIKIHQFNSLANRILTLELSRRSTYQRETEINYIEESQEELYPLAPQKSESLWEYHEYLEKYDQELEQDF